MSAASLVHLPILSNSSRTTFQRCPREYQFRYVLNRKSRRTVAALRFGSLFHRGLNAWWLAGDVPPSARLFVAIAAIDRDDHDPFDAAKANALLVGYTARWGDVRLETIAVEQMFRLPMVMRGPATNIVNGVTYYGPGPSPKFDLGGAIDAIARDERGHVHNVEHKTTSSDISVGADYWRHVHTLDPQVSTYDAAARAMGYDIRDTIYDVIRKPAAIPLRATPVDARKYTKPTKSEPIPRLYANQREADETPEEYGARVAAEIQEEPAKYFARMTIVRLEGDNAAHAEDVRNVARMISFCAADNSWPRAPSACERFGRLCDYHDVCSGLTTIEDETQFESKVRTHEELDV